MASQLLLWGSDQLRVRQGSVLQHVGRRHVVSLFVHRGSLLLCAASARPGSLSLSDQTPPPSVCQVLLCSESFAVNCLCFLSFFFTSLNFTHSLYNITYICISVHHSFPLLLFFSSSHSSSSSSISVTPPLPLPPTPGLCCAVAAHRSDQDRWSQMISGLYSFLQDTAWYCCWHNALTGCPQVQQCPNPITLRK